MYSFDEPDSIFQSENQIKLIEQIQSAPDCEIYGVSGYSQESIKKAQIATIIIIFTVAPILLILSPTLLSLVIVIFQIVSAVSAIAVLSYMNFSHNYYKTYVSHLGIAKKSKWDEGAIPWDRIEFLEVKYKGDELDYVIFRSDIKLGYRNSRFVRRLTWDIISEYLGGLDSWIVIDDIDEITESDRFYMRPSIEEEQGREKLKKMLLKDYIGEEDFDADQTQEQPSAKSDEVLYDLILNDPQCEVIIKQGRVSKLLSNWKTLLVLMSLTIIATIYRMFNGPFTSFAVVLIVILCVVMLIGVYLTVAGKETLALSPIGIVRHYMGSSEALEWQYVEFIDFDTMDDQIIPFEFFGNKKRILCPRHIYRSKITWDHITEYLPELSEWTRIRRDDWNEDIFRLVRPTA